MSRYVLGNITSPLLLKAPVGKRYKIHSITGVVVGTGTNSISVSDQFLEDVTCPVDLSTGINVIFTMNTVTTYREFQQLYKDFETKYLSIFPEAGAAVELMIIIEYELVNASFVELLWEYLGKRR